MPLEVWKVLLMVLNLKVGMDMAAQLHHIALKSIHFASYTGQMAVYCERICIYSIYLFGSYWSTYVSNLLVKGVSNYFLAAGRSPRQL